MCSSLSHCYQISGFFTNWTMKSYFSCFAVLTQKLGSSGWHQMPWRNQKCKNGEKGVENFSLDKKTIIKQLKDKYTAKQNKTNIIF